MGTSLYQKKAWILPHSPLHSVFYLFLPHLIGIPGLKIKNYCEKIQAPGFSLVSFISISPNDSHGHKTVNKFGRASQSYSAYNKPVVISSWYCSDIYRYLCSLQFQVSTKSSSSIIISFIARHGRLVSFDLQQNVQIMNIHVYKSRYSHKQASFSIFKLAAVAVTELLRA